MGKMGIKMLSTPTAGAVLGGAEIAEITKSRLSSVCLGLFSTSITCSAQAMIGCDWLPPWRSASSACLWRAPILQASGHGLRQHSMKAWHLGIHPAILEPDSAQDAVSTPPYQGFISS